MRISWDTIKPDSMQGACDQTQHAGKRRTLWKDGGATKPETERWSSADVLMQGEIALFKFSTTVPSNYTPNMKFYVMGNVIYHVDLGARYPVYFTRRYDIRTRQFVRTNDADYDTPD